MALAQKPGQTNINSVNGSAGRRKWLFFFVFGLWSESDGPVDRWDAGESAKRTLPPPRPGCFVCLFVGFF